MELSVQPLLEHTRDMYMKDKKITFVTYVAKHSNKNLGSKLIWSKFMVLVKLGSSVTYVTNASVTILA